MTRDGADVVERGTSSCNETGSASNTQALPWMACDAIEIEFAADDATYTALKELLQRAMIDCPSDLDIRE